VPFSLLAGYFLSRLVAMPIEKIALTAQTISDVDLPHLEAAALAIAGGDLTQRLEITAQPVDFHSTDELGRLADGLNTTIDRLHRVGAAFAHMTAGLHGVVRTVVDHAAQVSQAAGQLALAAQQAGEATSQIAGTIQQVAQGIGQQADSINRTSHLVERMGHSINGVAAGADQQAQAVRLASTATERLSGAIQGVSESAQAVSADSQGAAATARGGVGRVAEILEQMRAIRDQVSLSSARVGEMGQRSERIVEFVDVIEEIASQTNLLSVNAAIETARAEAQGHQLTESLLNRQMAIQCELLNEILILNGSDVSRAFWGEVAKQTLLDSICITDADGVIVGSNEAELLGWRFPDDPKEQAYAFRKLIHQPGLVTQEPMRRSFDNRIIKYIGVHRRDVPGVVQVGFFADTVAKFALQLGGFAVVAAEVNKLAEQARAAAKQISGLNREIQRAVGEAIRAIQASVSAVDAGVQNAGESGEALESILAAVENISTQAVETTRATEHMLQISKDLVQSVQSVSGVVRRNTEETAQMTRGSDEVTQWMENIASISQENSAAVEEVSASTEQMHAQVADVNAAAQSLAGLASDLQALVAQFHLETESRAAEPARAGGVTRGVAGSRVNAPAGAYWSK
jgi:methyl-accepting chemotaxis protein